MLVPKRKKSKLSSATGFNKYLDKIDKKDQSLFGLSADEVNKRLLSAIYHPKNSVNELTTERGLLEP